MIFYTACDNGTTNGQADPRCNETSITINVIANRPPTASSQSVAAAEDSSATVTLTASDADGDPVHFTIVTPPSHGTLTGTAPALTYVPAPNFHGLDTFTFAADDGTDQSAPATVAITVTEVNDPPAPQPDLTTFGAGSPVTVPTAFLLTNDVPGPFDEANQTLTVTAVTAGANAHGTASLSAGVVTYTPDSGFVGAAVIAYTVCDNGTTNGLADPRCTDSTLTIVLNGPPVAQGQSAETTRSGPLPLLLKATDPEGDALTYAIVAPPQHGTLSGTLPAVTMSRTPDSSATTPSRSAPRTPTAHRTRRPCRSSSRTCRRLRSGRTRSRSSPGVPSLSTCSRTTWPAPARWTQRR